MAATPEQKYATRVFLRITSAEAKAEGGLFALMDALDAVELAGLDALLVRVAALDPSDTKIVTDGVDIDPARERTQLESDIRATVGIGLDLGLFVMTNACEDADDADAD